MSGRIFVIGADAAVAAQICAVLQGAGFEAAGGADPRPIREFAASGHVEAVLVDEATQRPAPAELVPVLKRVLGHRTGFVLLTAELREHVAGSGFDATLRWPVARPVLVDRLRRVIAQVNAAVATVDPAFLAEVELRTTRLDRVNHYEVLEVGARAPADRIRDAYDRLALLFHPDRLPEQADGALREGVSAIAARISEAWRVLRDPAERARYDMQLQGGQKATARNQAVLSIEDFSQHPNTRKYLRLAQVAIAASNLQLALVQLRFAASLEPDNTFIATRIRELEAAAARIGN